MNKIYIYIFTLNIICDIIEMYFSSYVAKSNKIIPMTSRFYIEFYFII